MKVYQFTSVHDIAFLHDKGNKFTMDRTSCLVKRDIMMSRKSEINHMILHNCHFILDLPSKSKCTLPRNQ